MTEREHQTVVTVVTKGVDEAAIEPGQACLVVLYGQNIGKRYFLERAEQIIGRSDSVHVQVDQESVSRRHAEITSHQSAWRISDLGSTNGTFVNDKAITQTELRDGDLVRIGQTIFKYLSGTNIENKYHEEIYRLTTVDGLTQAFNKRYLIETLQRELNRSIRYGRPLALVMMDIDHFKKINDSHGHLAGDHILREMSALILKNVRGEDVFARYGGEEFACILPETDLESCVQMCEKLRRLIESQAFVYGEKRIPVTVSFGVTVLVGSQEMSVQDFIARADSRLYEAKQGGRNRVIA